MSTFTLEEKQQLMQELNAEIRRCTKCPLHQGRTHAVPGEGPLNAKVMFIGEGPGAAEDASGRPFVGPAGRFLNELLALAGLKREEVFMANTVKCFISPRVLIYTTEGYKPIKDIQVGDLVLTHKGRFRRVVYVRPHETLPKGSEVVQLTVCSLDRVTTRPVNVTVTPEHPFFIDNTWKSAHAIRQGDRLRALGHRCAVCERTYFVRHYNYDERTPTCSGSCYGQYLRQHLEAGQAINWRGKDFPSSLTRRRKQKDLYLHVSVFDAAPGNSHIPKRLPNSHAGEYTFVDVEVLRAERRQTQHAFRLYNIGVEEDESYIAAGLVSHNCRPPENRTPTTDEIAACHDYLVAQIALIQPKVICLLGSPALKTMLGAEYQISKVHGQVFEKEGMTFVPMFHPAAALHQDRYKMPLREDFVKLKGILAKELSREM